VERLVPAGCTLVVGARSSPTVWTLILYRDPSDEEKAARQGPTEIRRRRVYGRDLPHICRSTLMAWSQEKLAATV